MSSAKRILIAASMNGGAEAVAPVARQLRTSNVPVRVVSYGAATSTFRSMGLPPDQILDRLNPNLYQTTVSSFNPTHVLTGTQIQDATHPRTLEQILWDIAYTSRIPSVAVMDTWLTYRERFSILDIHNTSAPFSILHPLCILPNQIAIMDEYARTTMLGLGFPENVLTVTGNPYFEHVALQVKLLPSTTRADLLGKPIFSPLNPDGKIILFLSDAIERAYPRIGFTEKSVMQSFLRIADTYSEQTGQILNAVVRPHPFRDENAREAFACPTFHIHKILHNPAASRGQDPANDYSLEALLDVSDVVVGTFNNPQITAAILGRPVVHYIPEIAEGHGLYSFLTDRGITRSAASEQELMLALGDVFQQRWQSAPLGIDVAGSIDRVIQLLS